MNELIEVAKEIPYLALFVFVVLKFLAHLKHKDDSNNATSKDLSHSINENTTVLRELKNEITKPRHNN